MEESEKNVEVLCRRVRCGAGIWIATIVGLLLGAGGIAWGVYMLIGLLQGEKSYLIYVIILLALGGILFFADCFSAFRAIHSTRKGPYCLTYLPDTDECELFPIFGQPIRIARADLVAIGRNAMTDFLLVAAYRKDGALRKRRLGWSLDVPQATERLRELAARKKED